MGYLHLNYNYPGISNLQIGGGITVFDFNNDGWDDIFQAGGLFQSKLWLNNKGVFTDHKDPEFLKTTAGMYINGAVAGDVNNDGFEDLFIYNYGLGQGNGDRKTPVLLLNKKGKFSKCSTCVFQDMGFYTSATMSDFNNDGYLDIYVTNYVQYMSLLEDSNKQSIGYNPVGLKNRLYINNGNEIFSEKAAFYKVDDSGCGLACAFSDFDNDYDSDLLLANDFGEWTRLGNRLYQNSAPFFMLNDKSRDVGFYREMYGMGIGIGDYDNDLDLDYFITNIGKNLLLNNNKGEFLDKTDEEGLGNSIVTDSLPGTSWTPLFFDMDNDGDLDLYIAKGNVENYIPKAVIKDPNQLFENQEDSFVDRSLQSGLNCILSHRGAALIDFDNDGDLDIVSSPVKINYGAFSNLNQKIKLYRNNHNSQNAWVKFIVNDDTLFESVINVRCELIGDSSNQMREVDGGSGHASQSTKAIHFGLGKNPSSQLIRVYWAKDYIKEYRVNEFNRTWTLYRSGRQK